MSIPCIMIAAVKSGSGKTLVTCAYLKALKSKGLLLHAFKCGPDYIDTMYHRTVLDIPSNNLDSFFSDKEQLRDIYYKNLKNSDIAIVEGVMGLYDGVLSTSDEGSSYHIASMLDIPIMLVADVQGMGRSILSLLKGFLEYDTGKRIVGFFLNRISERYYETIKPVIERELKLPVLGFLPNNKDYMFESRHLGLKLPDETVAPNKPVELAADFLNKHCFTDKLIEIAKENCISEGKSKSEVPGIKCNNHCKNTKVKIGIARDEAFCFYYEENLELLTECGAELIFFSPIHDKALPKDLDALILGGGYPEIYAKELSDNYTMRQSVQSAIADGMPSIAECGGFMYLHEYLIYNDTAYEMCGAVKGKCYYTGRLVRFGYVNIREKVPNYLKTDGIIKGHEFHYYDSDNNGNCCVASKPAMNKNWECIHDEHGAFWGFPHLYYPSNPDFVVKFIEKAHAYHQNMSRL